MNNNILDNDIKEFFTANELIVNHINRIER